MNFGVCDFSRLAVTDWRLRRWRLWFLALSNAPHFGQAASKPAGLSGISPHGQLTPHNSATLPTLSFMATPWGERFHPNGSGQLPFPALRM